MTTIIPSSISPPTLRLAERISNANYVNIPKAAKEVGKQALMDFIGVTVAGMEEPLSQILIDEADEAGGHAQATLIGSNRRTNVQQAALINGSAGHAHDYDDVVVPRCTCEQRYALRHHDLHALSQLFCECLSWVRLRQTPLDSPRFRVKQTLFANQADYR